MVTKMSIITTDCKIRIDAPALPYSSISGSPEYDINERRAWDDMCKVLGWLEFSDQPKLR